MPLRMPVSHIRHWVFDLDNTLYPASARLFDEIETRMEAFIMRELAIDLAAARALRARFWHSHGTTLAGLMEHHGVDPDHFLEEVHEIDLSPIRADTALASAIGALGGSRVIYTNGSRAHAERVSRARGVREHFHGVYGIEDAGFQPKPRREAFLSVFGRAGIEARAAVMFEDDPRNLVVPAELGMTTVLVGAADPQPHIHHQTNDLTGFLSESAACGCPPR